MSERKIYLTAEKWWEERKKVLNEDLSNAEGFITDQKIVKLMQELLDKMEVSIIDKKEGG